MSAFPTWSLLASYLRPQWPRATLLGGLLLTSAAFQLAGPLVLRTFIDGALAGRTATALAGIAVLFLSIALATQALAVAAAYIGEMVAWTATNALRGDLLLHCLQLDLHFHHAHTPGALIERVDGDVTALASFFSTLVLRVVASLLLLVGMLAVTWHEDWHAGVGLAVFALVALAVLISVRDLAVTHWQGEREASSQTFGFIEEQLAGREDILSCGAQPYVLGRLRGLLEQLRLHGRKASVMNGVVISTAFMIFALGNALALGLGAYLFARGTITLGTVYVLFAYTETVLRYPLLQVAGEVQNLQRASASARRITDLLAQRSRLPLSGSAVLPPGPLSVAFERVSFRYTDHAPTVLHDISFELQPGTMLGLIGRTGSGKSTLARLALRLYDSTAGSVRLSGIDLRTLHNDELARRVGMVTQDVQLFAASLRDNLTLFDASIPDERITQVLGELGLWDWYCALPQGLATRIGAGGRGLSAGEAQLLACARVFLRDPGLIIFDEASSRLDPASERLLEHAVERLLAGRTAIVIAHRLQTLQRADTIMQLDGGKIIEYDPRTQHDYANEKTE